MKTKIFFRGFSTLSFCFFLLVACKNKNYIHKEELEGVYTIIEAEPLEPVKDSAKMKRALGWKLFLQDKDNFVIGQDTFGLYGYWAFAEAGSGKLLFNSGGYTAYTPFSKTQIAFENAHPFFDSLFKRVVYERLEEK